MLPRVVAAIAATVLSPSVVTTVADVTIAEQTASPSEVADWIAKYGPTSGLVIGLLVIAARFAGWLRPQVGEAIRVWSVERKTYIRVMKRLEENDREERKRERTEMMEAMSAAAKDRESMRTAMQAIAVELRDLRDYSKSQRQIVDPKHGASPEHGQQGPG